MTSKVCSKNTRNIYFIETVKFECISHIISKLSGRIVTQKAVEFEIWANSFLSNRNNISLQLVNKEPLHTYRKSG